MKTSRDEFFIAQIRPRSIISKVDEIAPWKASHVAIFCHYSNVKGSFKGTKRKSVLIYFDFQTENSQKYPFLVGRNF